MPATPQTVAPVSPTDGRLQAAVVLAAIAAHARAPWNGWSVDDTVIAAHPLLQQSHTIPDAVLSPWWPLTGHLWRPLATLLIGVQLRLGAGAAWLPHATNVLLHALIAMLLFRLARRWLAPLPALAAALLFSLLPAHAEAVATLVGVAELLAAAPLVALMLVVTRDAPPTPRARLAAALLAAAALGGKEGGVAAPLLALAAAWTQPAARRHAWSWAGAALAGTAAMLAARLAVLGSVGGDIPHALFRTLSLAERLPLALSLLPRSAAMLLLPVAPAINEVPAWPLVEDPPAAAVVLGGAMVVVALVALAMHWRRPTPWTLGMIVIAATLAPTANILFATGVVLSGRSMYLPSAGAALLAGTLVATATTPGARRLTAAAVAVLLAWCGLVTWREVPVWRSTGTAVAAAARRSPDSWWPARARAYLARDGGSPREALVHFETAARLFPRDWEMLTDAATVALAQGDTVRATTWLRLALDAHPRAARARVRLAALQRARGDSAAARRLLEAGMRADTGRREPGELPDL